MRIELEIDDKYKDTNLYLMWGMVPIARWKLTNQFWEVKTEECSQCGKCCSSLGNMRHPFKIVDGVCGHLNSDNLCDLSSLRPFGCCVADQKHVPECTVRWKRV